MDRGPPGFSVYGISQARILNGLPLPPPGIFLTQALNLGLLHWQVDSFPLSHLGSPNVFKVACKVYLQDTEWC